MDDLICSGPPDSQSANSQSRNILAHFASKGWLFNSKKTKPPSTEARSFNAFQINSTSPSGFEIQGKPEAILAMEAMAGALIVKTSPQAKKPLSNHRQQFARTLRRSSTRRSQDGIVLILVNQILTSASNSIMAFQLVSLIVPSHVIWLTSAWKRQAWKQKQE